MINRNTIYRFFKDYGLFFIFVLAAFSIFQSHELFWDTVQLAGKHAYWYYETNFQYLLLPEHIDSGHPPLFGIYLAWMWKLLDKSLFVSHFAILPFTLWSIYSSGEIGKFFLGRPFWVVLPLLLILDPTFAAQNILVSPDAVLIALFLASILAVLEQKRVLLICSTALLALVSMRGMMCVAALYVFYTYHYIFFLKSEKLNITSLFQSLTPFLLAILLASSFLVFHYIQTGWIGYHTDSPWSASFERVDVAGFLKNIAILGWRLLDFGRVAELLVLAILFFYTKKYDVKLLLLLILVMANFIFLTPSLLLHQGLSAHRYLLPIFVSLHLLTLYMLLKNTKSKTVVLGLVFLMGSSLLLGNFWKYDKDIAQGWDASLAHLPYHRLRAQALAYLEIQAIPLEQVGTVFPEVGERKFRALNDQEEGFKLADLRNDSYILYASVMNDFSNEALRELETKWTIEQRWESFGIEVILYKRL